MKKLVLMFVFAGFAAFVSAQTEPTAATKTQKSTKSECARVCTAEEKMAGCAVVAKTGCCAKPSATATAAKTEKADAKKAVASTGNKK